MGRVGICGIVIKFGIGRLCDGKNRLVEVICYLDFIFLFWYLGESGIVFV